LPDSAWLMYARSASLGKIAKNSSANLVLSLVLKLCQRDSGFCQLKEILPDKAFSFEQIYA
jgi:hypothetical protein